MLIQNAELEGGTIQNVRIEGGTIAAIGKLHPFDREELIDANGGLLLPGLHDNHIHVAALAASLNSVRCGPPDVVDLESLEKAMRRPGTGWLRGIGYHESVAGMLDTALLDRIAADRPVRIQHRSGRMWFFNSAALELLLASAIPAPGLERDGARYTGRLFDADAWLQQTLRSAPPSFADVGTALSSMGVTGLTEMSPANDALVARHFTKESATASLRQRFLLAGKLELAAHDVMDRIQLGLAKLHLHEAQLPTLDAATAFIRAAHERDRAVAVHCATEVELVFALAAIADAGVMEGDRIEHAAVTPDHAIDEIARLGLAVISQPHFIHERGDTYLRDVDLESQPLLYRLRAFLDAGVTLAAGSDAPFGNCDPWLSMASAVSRQTQFGLTIGECEALTPEQALDLYLREPTNLNRRRRVAVGMTADLCLLNRPWEAARNSLSSAHVRATLIEGRFVFDRINQLPT